ncbi:hypothetical protein JCM8097_005953 [Rhodosporidiobolus ruineniae]
MAPSSKRTRTCPPTDHLDDPSDFHSPALRALDHSLRCPICQQLFSSPVLLSTCSHAFDSLCLRQHLAQTRKCPTCHAEANEDRIRPVHQLEQAVRDWKTARVEILELQKRAAQPVASTSALPPTSTSRRASSSPSPSLAAPDRKGKRKASPVPKSEPVEELVLTDSDGDVEVQSPPRKKGRKEVNGKGKGKEEAQEDDLTDPNLIVSCPICSLSVKNSHVMSHIQSKCKIGVVTSQLPFSSGGGGKSSGRKNAFEVMSSAKKARGGRGTPSSESDLEAEMDTTQPLPLRDYHSKPVKELQKLLKEYHLPPTGPSTLPSSIPASSGALAKYHRDVLADRLAHFSRLWNANTDTLPSSSAHKSAREIRAELGRWEEERERGRKEAERARRGEEKRAAAAAAGGGGGGAKGGVDENSRQRAAEWLDLIASARASGLALRKEQRRAAVEQTVQEQKQVEEEPKEMSPTLAGEGEGVGAQGEAREDVEMGPPAGEAVDPIVEPVEAASQPAPPAAAPSIPAATRSSTRLRRLSPSFRSAALSPTPSSPTSESSTASLSPSPPPFFRDGSDPPELPSRRARKAERAARLRLRVEQEQASQDRGKAEAEADGEEEEEEDEEGEKRWRMPRPSQRNRAEERMFAELQAARITAAGGGGGGGETSFEVIEEEEEGEEGE